MKLGLQQDKKICSIVILCDAATKMHEMIIQGADNPAPYIFKLYQERGNGVKRYQLNKSKLEIQLGRL
ncbi:MAG: hypothetical protein J6O61_09340 [Butyrivibrio sp.]|uniref:hypothetical protein n=1 Tax=Butyrivibrio sp. TaxID=28121 RepID=UPI001AFE7E5A|nr:hypothetical protein [Butyrivibrio sp.]MBO6241014.1 hypothetical protein [Butyrivibrio sp.]